MTVTNSTISGNSATEVGTGGILIEGGTVTVTNSTVSGNSAVGGTGGIAVQSGTLTMINSTVANNVGMGVQDPVGGIANVYGTVLLGNGTVSGNIGLGLANFDNHLLIAKNSILALNSAGNCFMAVKVYSGGFNLSDDSTCANFFTGTGDLNSTSAGLDPNGLKDNGGPTQTIALLATSPAVDAIPSVLRTSAPTRVEIRSRPTSAAYRDPRDPPATSGPLSFLPIVSRFKLSKPSSSLIRFTR